MEEVLFDHGTEKPHLKIRKRLLLNLHLRYKGQTNHGQIKLGSIVEGSMMYIFMDSLCRQWSFVILGLF